ncbi:MAG: type 4a pilus biogenesis protein PilO [Patescibacteria group bacterium]
MQEKKMIIYLIIIVGLIFLSFFFLVRPNFLAVKNLSQRIEYEQKTLEELRLKGQTLAKTKKEFKEIEGEIPILERFFLIEGEELNFITSLEEIAQKNNISQEINLGTKQNFKNSYKVMPVNLSLKGSFINFINYLREIEKLDFYFNIDSLNITTISPEKDEINVSLTAKTYWKK